MNTGKGRKRIGQIWLVLGPFLKIFLKISGVILLAQLLFMAFQRSLGQALDAIAARDSFMLVLSLVSVALAIVGDKLAGSLIAIYHINFASLDIEDRISDMTLTRMLGLSIGQVTNHNSGFKVDTLKKGESAIGELLNTFFMEAIPTLTGILINLAVLFFVNWRLGASAAACVALYVTASIWINVRMLPRIKANSKVETRLGTAYWEIVKHLRLVMVCNQEERTVKEFSEKYGVYAKENKSIWTRYVNLLTLAREPFSAIGQVAVYVTAAWLAWHGEITMGTLLFASSMATSVFRSLNTIGSMQRRLVRNFVIAGKYFDLLDLPPAITVPENPVMPERFEGKIEFRNVSFQYPDFTSDHEDDSDGEEEQEKDERPVALKNISFKLEKGTVCAFVGASGSGKSTAINLLFRGYDVDSGEVLFDDHNVNSIDYRKLRQSIGIVEQDPKLWDATLRDNILFSVPDRSSVSEEKLNEVVRMARIDQFWERLEPLGLETQIGENGVQLSGGQRQRVAIARALVKDPSVLILDEATNALDPTNEKLVHQAIREALNGRTGIIIAHRLSTIRQADMIVVFDKGSIAGVGTHGELMESCKAYQELVECEVGEALAA